MDSARKAEIRKLIVDYSIGEDLIDDGGSSEATVNALELKRLEYQERKRERENQLRLKEIELKEKELTIQLKLKELETPRVSHVTPHVDRSVDFDISKQIRFVLHSKKWKLINTLHILRKLHGV